MKYHYSPWWKQRSKDMRAKFPKCYVCTRPAEVTHHRHYKSLNAEPDRDLITLCAPCHDCIEKGVQHGRWSREDGHSAFAQARRDDDQELLKEVTTRSVRTRKRESNKTERRNIRRNTKAEWTPAFAKIMRQLVQSNFSIAAEYADDLAAAIRSKI